ncbi:hypothetical protein [Streptomyces californicus]|uniref:hypothetical protein n=1 Tax=Streptomyces californicus TaxID=67351 RepID=UPI0004C091D4|nr:hypothetical protein [Streptomyces californicus]QRV56417.1 hypothetical protein I6J40_21110 [Streptomyces californicus]
MEGAAVPPVGGEPQRSLSRRWGYGYALREGEAVAAGRSAGAGRMAEHVDTLGRWGAALYAVCPERVGILRADARTALRAWADHLSAGPEDAEAGDAARGRAERAVRRFREAAEDLG